MKGLVLENGGVTSHTIILARAAGIPTIVGIEGACQFCTGQREMIIDGSLGILIRQPSDQVGRYYQLEQHQQNQLMAQYDTFKSRTAYTNDGTRLEIAANIACSDEAGRALHWGRRYRLVSDRNAVHGQARCTLGR